MRDCGFPNQLGATGSRAAAYAGSGCSVPRNQVLLTSLHSIGPLISGLARCYRLSHADTQDARQEAVFWTLAAIRAFELVKCGGGQAFRPFSNA